ncbi:MAG: alkaline phosphatase [Planctomycetota bacterium]|nr:alkaline phosphatase [Planctomycetota bacterium]
MKHQFACAVWATILVSTIQVASGADPLRELQLSAATSGQSPAAHWGPNPAKYISWSSHSLRLIPVYTFGTAGMPGGIDLNQYQGENSLYRNTAEVIRLYERLPSNTINTTAPYLDQTNLAAIQRAAIRAGKKHVILFVFDGMDWHTTRAAAIYRKGEVAYSEGRGTGLHFLDYTANGTTQFGAMVTAPHNDGTRVEVNLQRVINPGGTQLGGYNAAIAGEFPWSVAKDPWYMIGKVPSDQPGEHPYPDSAATATAMCSGTKTYNEAINVDSRGVFLPTVAHEAQHLGYSIGVVTSVPISHATPACAYAHNVSRDDYQDISRDLLGLPSRTHPREPLPGVDVLIGGGCGDQFKPEDLAKHRKQQGENFEPGNLWVADSDLFASAVENGGRYVVAQRTAGTIGREVLQKGVDRAVAENRRLLGYFGVGAYSGHLPFRTADGNYDPVRGKTEKMEKYEPADITENPTLADMTRAALDVVSRNPKGFWLMVESGDVDWANHDNNIDNSIGAVNSGDAAVKIITDWVEANSNWNESLVIVTADHGHMLNLVNPEFLFESTQTVTK